MSFRFVISLFTKKQFYSISLKNSTDIKTANLKNVAFESFKEDIFDAMAKENPELYRSLVQFINSKSQEE